MNDNKLTSNNQKTQSEEQKLLIKSTVIISSFLTLNLIFSGLLMMFYFDRRLFGIIMLSAGVLFTINLLLFGVTRNWRWFRFFNILIGIILPISLHIALGGYINSGGIIMWGILIILWAVVIEETKLKYFWFLAYIFAAIILSFWEQEFSLSTAAPFPVNQQVFLTLNLLISLTVCIFIVFDINQSKLKKEKIKSEELLLNILPYETAQELKTTGTTQSKSYDSVTVMFTDFKGFTKIAEHLSPENIVKELHYCFKHFDLISKKYGLEKIKTIGDAYMCAGGLPSTNETHPIDVVNAGLEMRDFIDKWKKEHIEKKEPMWDVRIGIHTGKVVAGVVGVSKFSYDIWGDTVNIASRMESSGSPGEVNISGETYTLIKKHFECTPRGKIEAINKGEIEMFFVKSSKEPLS